VAAALVAGCAVARTSARAFAGSAFAAGRGKSSPEWAAVACSCVGTLGGALNCALEAAAGTLGPQAAEAVICEERSLAAPVVDIGAEEQLPAEAAVGSLVSLRVAFETQLFAS